MPRLTPGNATADREGRRHPASRRPASSLRTSRRLIRTESPLTNGCVGRYALRLTISVSEVPVLDQGPTVLTFILQRHSLHGINSIAILAAAQIPVQMEFLVGTGQRGRVHQHEREPGAFQSAYEAGRNSHSGTAPVSNAGANAPAAVCPGSALPGWRPKTPGSAPGSVFLRLPC